MVVVLGCGLPITFPGQGTPSPTPAPTAQPAATPTPTPATPAMHGNLSAAEVAQLRQAVVDRINQHRASAALPPVQLDDLASRVSDAFCAKQMLEGTHGHFTTEGLKPYHRYGLAGGTDNNTENAAAMWCSSGTSCFDTSFASVRQALLDMEDHFFNEQPPNDGHRRAILDPAHTHVGVGFAFSSQGLRMTEEFLNRYITMSGFPKYVSATGSVSVSGKVDDPSTYSVYSITVFYEVPVQRTVDEVNQIHSYGYPSDPSARKDYFPGIHFVVQGDGSFTLNVPLFAGAPGYYTVVVWLAKAGQSPFTATDAVIVAQ